MEVSFRKVSVSLPEDVLVAIEEIAAEDHYGNRSRTIQDAAEEFLARRLGRTWRLKLSDEAKERVPA